MTSIQTHINELKASIPKNVSIVAVSKTKPNSMLLEAYEAGQLDFGENYVQELVDKQKSLPTEIRWHFIGHLQSNKVKYIAPFVYLIHSVDSFKLLMEIDKQAKKNNRIIDCLLQIYIAQEETKFGFDRTDCFNMLESDSFKALKNIRICGLMGMASFTAKEDQIEKEFATIKQLFDEIQKSNLLTSSFQHLSIGMSSDYLLAIKQGSNMIRVGSMIFGNRNYNS
jgi:pyridoxal phosphate enzyme (YggS family)